MRTLAWCIAIAVASSAGVPSAGAAATLPDQAAGVRIGDDWLADDPRFAGGSELSLAVAPWDRRVRECGYRVVRLEVPGAELVVEIEDATVTRLVHRQPLPVGRSLLEHAEALIATYGQPSAAVLRDANGAVTIERAEATFVSLIYDAPSPVRFTVSGPPARAQTTVIEYKDRRWHQNKMMRCARTRSGERN